MKRIFFIVAASIGLFPFVSYAVPGPITGLTSVCAGSTITLSDATAGGTWSSTPTTIATVGSATGIVSGIMAGVATITYTDGSGYVTTTVTVAPAPVITATVTPSTMCANGMAALSAYAGVPGMGYVVYSIPYALSTITTSLGNVMGDDVNSGAVALPFTFNFYGANYNTIYVCTNGYISFNSGGTGLSNYVIPSGGAAGEVGAGISFGMCDLNTGSGGTITYGYAGTAPNRVFIVYYNSVSDYGGTGIISGQVILHEGTNIVDEMLTSRNPTGHSWTMGIQGNTAPIGIAVPGRNATSLSVSTAEGWRFSPSVPVTYLWSPATFLNSDTSTGPVISGEISALTYTVVATSASGCAMSDTVHVNVTPVTVGTHYVINAPDTLCNAPDFYITSCCVTPSLNVTTYFGDGTSSNTALTSSGTSHADVFHTYDFPGCYLVKQVLNLGTTPVDSFSFSYEYLYCRTLPLKLYFDSNGDCNKEITEPYNSRPTLVEVDSDGIAIDTVSVTSGLYYKAFGPPGVIYSFRIISSTFAVSCPASGILYDTILAAMNTYPVKYLGLTCSVSTAFDLSVSAVVPSTGPNQQEGDIYVSNNLCPATNGTITLFHSPKYDHTPVCTPAATSTTTSSITWNLSGLSSSNPDPVDLHYKVWASTALIAGDTVHEYVVVTPTGGDADTSNNSEVIFDTVKASCDPNEMFVVPAGCISSGIDAVKLEYTINFMNVGNDTAFDIHVLDTLSDNVDPRTLRIVMASNTMDIALFNDGVHNIVKFDFPQIDLLDSSTCPQCNGAVIFDVNTTPGLPDGTIIFNRAGVFFDDNAVVMTNMVEDIIGCPGTLAAANNGSDRNQVQIYPNPADEELTIVMAKGGYTSFTITNSIGQEMMQQSLVSTQTKVNISSLATGVYYITLRGVNGTKVQKFVKL